MEPFGFFGIIIGLLSIFLGIAWFVCCIVLFFKVWGMCNNVSRILQILEQKSEWRTEWGCRRGYNESGGEIKKLTAASWIIINLKSNIMITRKKQRHHDEYGVLSDVIE